ncbi:MAG: biotin transporter BioY, partial [Candidatus Symbiothrix sp.]|nr:biotin transporter BioY [Candidatus Symbiothrix sp.]
MKTKLFFCTLLFSTITAFSQSVTEKDLQEIRGSFQKDASTTAIQNILTTQSDIKSHVLNHDLQSGIDHFFKYRVEVKGITNQKSSGRCWMFASMNVLRPLIMAKYELNSFDFSHNYLYFWDIFEKANLYLENMIGAVSRPMDDREVVELFKSPVGDGGVWNLYYNAALKYGVVPDAVMPETAHSNATNQMISILNEKLRGEGYNLRELAAKGKKEKDLRTEKQAILKDVYRMLALCLGEPPTQFTWKYKTKAGKIEEKQYTP